MTKTLNKPGIGGNFLNMLKTIYEKSTAIIIHSDEGLKAFPLRSRTRQGCPLLPILLNIIIEQSGKKRIKGNRIGKEDVKLSLFTDDMILYVENLKEFTSKNC